MKPRISYKSKWLASEARAEGWKAQYEELRYDYDRIKGVLAAEGKKLSRTFDEREGDNIVVTPLEFDCILAFIQSNSRVFVDDVKSWRGLYSWRGRPIIPQLPTL